MTTAHEHQQRAQGHLVEAYRRHKAGGDLEAAELGYAQAHALLALVDLLGAQTSFVQQVAESVDEDIIAQMQGKDRNDTE